MSKATIAVIDYGMGNLHSVASALEHVAPNHDIVISSDAEVIGNAERIIFPGVGAMRDCMAEIKRLNFHKLVPELISDGKPVLGICVGMQALMSHSEENGGVDAIDQLPGQVTFFGDDLTENGQRLKVPHMGWNTVQQNAEHPLWHNIDNHSHFYFVHSYYAKSDNPEVVIGQCQYGLEFDVVLAKDNLAAVQFHPEKSHSNGLQLLKNFSQWQTDS